MYAESEFVAEAKNYKSAKEVSDKIQQQLQAEEQEGFVYPLSLAEARKRFGSKLRIASLGAIDKESGDVRVLFDATHSMASWSWYQLQRMWPRRIGVFFTGRRTRAFCAIGWRMIRRLLQRKPLSG